MIAEPTPLLTFDTTHHALWAEQIAIERGLAAQVVPAPPESAAKCDLALEVLAEDLQPLMAALADSGVEFRPWFRTGFSA
jgi:hypothetical protein